MRNFYSWFINGLKDKAIDLFVTTRKKYVTENEITCHQHKYNMENLLEKIHRYAKNVINQEKITFSVQQAVKIHRSPFIKRKVAVNLR